MPNCGDVNLAPFGVNFGRLAATTGWKRIFAIIAIFYLTGDRADLGYGGNRSVNLSYTSTLNLVASPRD